MSRHTAETTRSSRLRDGWPRWLRHGVFAMALCAPAAAYAASGSAASDDIRTRGAPAYVTHSEANPASSSATRETQEELRNDDYGRLRDVDSAQSNFQPASTDTVPNVPEHPYAQSHFELGAGHQQ
ncbi:MAG TPA: hypothetical protein VHO67_00530 [Polyangia bacterium]|nr:hypothetical protein [Polyangia bacterium]